MTKASDNAFPSILITEATEPSAPAAGKQRLYIDSTSHLLKATNSSGTERTIEAGTALVGASVVWTNASNYTRTGSTAFADVDATNLSHTITTGAHKVMIGASFSAAVTSSGHFMMIDFTVDSTRQGNTDGLVVVSSTGGAGLFATSLTIITASALTAASHTFRLQFAVGNAAHTGTIFATSALTPVSFWVMEMPF